jgi:hypothetical protein
MAEMEAAEHPWVALEPPVPPYVVGEAAELRWRKAETLASNTFGLPPNDPLVMSTTRVVYHDRDHFVD